MSLTNQKDTNELCDKIQELASIGLTGCEIAIYLDLDENEFIRKISNAQDPFYKAYRKGIISTASEILKKEVDFAKKGSPAAIKNYFKILKKQIRDAEI